MILRSLADRSREKLSEKSPISAGDCTRPPNSGHNPPTNGQFLLPFQTSDVCKEFMPKELSLHLCYDLAGLGGLADVGLFEGLGLSLVGFLEELIAGDDFPQGL